MASNSATHVAGLRSRTLQIQPDLVDRIFDDPDEVISIIEERAPYPTLAVHLGFNANSPDAQDVSCWFRSHFDDALFLVVGKRFTLDERVE